MKSYKNFVSEKLDIKKTEMGDVIKDFQQSDAPQFQGKSKTKRREMAIAAKMQAEGTTQPNGTDKIDPLVGDIAPKKKTEKEMKDAQNESFTFDSAAMAKQELADAKNRKKRKRGKVANLLRKLGMKEETEQDQLLEYEIDHDGKGNYRDDEGNEWSSNDKHRPRGSFARRHTNNSGGSDHPHAVHINGKKWKTFGSHSHASNVAKKIKGATVHKEEAVQSLKQFVQSIQEAAKPAAPVNVDKVNAAGQAPHEEKWEAAKKAVKKESYTADQLLQALKEGMWPGTPEYKAKFDNQAKQGGGAGVKKGSRYGGSLQKPDTDNDNDADDNKPAAKKNK